jgi:hypothetical protein
MVMLHYRVHSSSREMADADVEFEGQKVRAQLPHHRVELVIDEENRRHGTLILRFPGSEAEEVAELFPTDSTGTMSFEPGEAPPKEEAPAKE